MPLKLIVIIVLNVEHCYHPNDNDELGQQTHYFITELNTSAWKVFDEFLRAGVHGADWPARTWCVVKTPRGWVCRNNKYNDGISIHAEYFFMQFLKQLIVQELICMSLNVTIFLVYSPCYDCACKLIEFKNDIKKIFGCTLNLEIVASAPYKCYRESCPVCVRQYFIEPLNRYLKFKMNTEGVRALHMSGIKVRAFTGYEEWADLANILNGLQPTLRQAVYTKQNYEYDVIGVDKRHNLCHTRKQADVFARQDFAYIANPNFVMPADPEWYEQACLERQQEAALAQQQQMLALTLTMSGVRISDQE